MDTSTTDNGHKPWVSNGLPPHNGRPKVVRIICRLSVGGPAHHIALLHRALEEEFETVLVTGSLFDGETCAEHLLHSVEKLHRVSWMQRPISPLHDLVALARITAILRRERPDIVHTHCSKAGALGRLAAVLAGVPVRVHTYHGCIFEHHFGPVQSRLYLGIERLLSRITTRAIALSRSQAEVLGRNYRVLPQEKISIIRNGYELSRNGHCGRRTEVRQQLGTGEDQTLVVWAGRLVPIKNPDLMAEIVRAARHDPRLRFAIVGHGTERARLQRSLAGCSNVVFTGWWHDMPAMWAASDVALLTSHNEGTPAALIEAMAAGKPFVSTSAGGVVDLALPPVLRKNGNGILHARNAFLVPPSADEMLDCLTVLASDPELRCRMGSAGQDFVLDQFSAERLVKEISGLYRELLNDAVPADNDTVISAA